MIDKLGPTNQLIVGPREALGKSVLLADDANWISGAPPRMGQRAMVQIRYTAKERPARVYPEREGRFKVIFDDHVRDITPGQAAVVFVEDEVLGHGIIRSAQRVQS